MFQMLDNIDRKLRNRIEKVASTATQCGERGIVDWAVRAANDAVALGHIREHVDTFRPFLCKWPGFSPHGYPAERRLASHRHLGPHICGGRL